MRKLVPRGFAIGKGLGLAWADGVDTLYKFRSFAAKSKSRKGVLDTIERSRIYCSFATQFNDPFDVMPIFRHSGNPSDPKYVEALRRRQERVAKSQGHSDSDIRNLERQLGATVHELPRLIEQQIRGALREGTRMLCLTANQLHALQWSHYADSHKGVCLHFRSTVGSVFGQARRVKYTSRRTPIRISPQPIKTRGTAERLAYTKARFWSYEHEYRFVRPDGVENLPELRRGYLHFDSKMLTGITLGMQMSGRDKASILRFLHRHRPDLPVWEAYPDPDRFELKVQLLGRAINLRA